MRAEAVSQCPKCGDDGVPLLFGRVVPEASQAAAAGELRLAGCLVPDLPPNWACGREHTWRDVTDRRGWDVRLNNILEAHGYVDGVTLDDLESAVEARTERWQDAGLGWQITRWPRTEKPAASLRVQHRDAEGDLTLWESGEVEMTWSMSGSATEIDQEHYDLTSFTGLSECLYDLEERLGLPEPQ